MKLQILAALAGVATLIPAGAAPAQDAPAEPPAAATAEAPEPAPKAEKSSVIVLDLKPTNADPETARLITDLVAVSLGRSRAFGVLTSEDVRSVVALEAEKHAMGCDDASCLAEIAGAMGADYVVHGSVGALGDLFVVNLNLFDSQKAKSVGRESAQVRDRAELPGAIDRMVSTLVRDLVPEEMRASAEPAPEAEPVGDASPAPVAEPAGSPPFLSPLFLGGAAGLVLCAGGAAGLGVVAAVSNGTVEDKTAPGADRVQAKTVGQASVIGAAALGVAAVVAGGIAVVPFVLE